MAVVGDIFKAVEQAYNLKTLLKNHVLTGVFSLEDEQWKDRTRVVASCDGRVTFWPLGSLCRTQASLGMSF